MVKFYRMISKKSEFIQATKKYFPVWQEELKFGQQMIKVRKMRL